MRQALLIYNPAAGRRRQGARLDAIRAALRDGGIEAEPVPTGERDHATELARAAARDRDLVLAYGGDGTIREVATGILGTRAVLGVVPGGTANVVATAFGLVSDPVAAARRLGSLKPRPVDVGLCAGRPFLMQASSGIEAHLMARLDERLKQRFGYLGPVLQSPAALFSYPFPELELEADGVPLRAMGAMVCNISEVAGPYRMVPWGRFDDGRLELLLYRGKSRAAVVGFAIDLFFGRHVRRTDVEIRPVEVVRLLGPRGASVQIDGDPLREPHPIEVRLAPQRLLALAEAETPQDRAPRR